MLVDNNVLIDVALRRQPFFGAGADLLERLAQSPGRGFMAWHTVSTFYYIVHRTLGDERTRSIIAELSGFLTVASVTHESLLYALSLPMADFEDAMQVAAAQAAGAEHVVTRDLGDFTNSPIPALTPAQALREFF